MEFKLQAAMQHSMDFDGSCYYVEHIHTCADEFVQDSLMKDDLENLLKEESPLGETNQDGTRFEYVEKTSPKKKRW